jgi:type IV pilus assembly protein PilB
MLKVINEKIGNILIAQGLLTETDLVKALEEQKKKGFKQKLIGHFLSELGYVSEQDVLKALGIQFNLPVMELKEMVVEPAVLELVPEAMARRFKILPLYRVEKELTVALSDPTEMSIMDVLAHHTRMKVQPVLAIEREILSALESNYRVRTQPAAAEEAILNPVEIARLEQAGKEIPIIRLVDEILLRAVQEGASDIHIEPRERDLSVRFRVDGILKEYYSLTIKQHPAIVSRIKILSILDISERQKPQDGRMKLKTADRQVDVRVSMLPTVYGEKVVLRLLDQQKIQLDLQELGLSPHNLNALSRMIAQPYGLILVTGPTGSGKSTTLYAALNVIKSETKNIITVEDPVEYQIPLIVQVQVNPKKEVTFATALRAILRQDPNVIMIGEIRDAETGEIATESALTGHLVLSTLHTNDAPSAVVRLMEMGIEPFLLAPSLIGIVAQRLARRICADCKEEYTPGVKELERLGVPGLTSRLRFARGKGCPSCKGSGYRGRIAIHEVLVADEAVRSLITERAPVAALREHAVRTGFVELRMDGILKMAKGMTTFEEVLRVTRGL